MDFAVLIVFAVILALITVVVYNLGRLLPKSKFGSKNAFIWTCILIGFMVSLLGIIIAVNLTKHGEDELKLDKAIKETHSILVKAQHHVESISFDTLDWSSMERQKMYLSEIPQDIVYFYRRDVGFSKEAYEYDLIINENWFPLAVTLNKRISKNIENMNKAFPAGCGEKITYDQLNERTVSINTSIGITMNALAIVDNNMKTMKNMLQKPSDEQVKLEFVESMIKERLVTMKKMVEKIRTDISKSDETEQEWGRKIRELAPFWITENIVKLLVNVVCIMLIIMSIISIITLYRPSLFRQNIFPSKLISILFCITAILTIISGLIVLAVSIGTVGQFDCPLKNNTFGVANFTVPIPDSTGNRDFSFCALSKSTVFDRIFPLINRDEIYQKLKIEEYKKKMLPLYVPSLTPYIFPSSLSEDLESIRKVNGTMYKLFEKNCLETNIQEQLSEDCYQLNKFMMLIELFKGIFDDINEQRINEKSIFEATVEKRYSLLVDSYEFALNEVTKNITAVDFPCESIVAGYSECAHSICKQFDSPLDTYSIYLLITILICLISLIIFSSIYNSLTIINEDIKSDSKSVAITPT